MNSLTPNAIQSLISDEAEGKPVVQLIGIKKISGDGMDSDRYRLLISDGKKCSTSVLLASQLNELIIDGQLENNSIIRLDKYMCSTVNEKCILIILELTVLNPGSGCSKIGNPEPYKQGSIVTKVGNQEHHIQEITALNSMPGNAKPYSNDKISNLGPINPISSLTPYQNKWVIKGRVVNKSSIRTWSNSRGEGKLFSIDILDESGEIKGTFFNEFCDKYYNTIEQGKIYLISKASLKVANRMYTTINNDYEMSFNSESQIVICNDDSSVPNVKYNIVPINGIVNLEKDVVVDILGVIIDIQDLQNIVSRNLNKEISKRNIVVMDHSNHAINVTLWGNDAQNFLNSSHLTSCNGIIAIKSARVAEFNGKYLSLSVNSSFLLNPNPNDIPEINPLKSWLAVEGGTSEVKSKMVNISQMDGSKTGGFDGMGNFNTPWKCLSQIKDENLGLNDKPDYFTTRATITFYKKENCLYQACPSSDCNKKIIDMNNGRYRCEKCQKDTDNFKWRILLSLNIADFSGSQWITVFQENAEQVLKTTSQELGDMRINNPEKFDEVFQEANFKTFIFKLRAKMETFNEESRLKIVSVNIKPLDVLEENTRLIAEIKKLTIDK